MKLKLNELKIKSFVTADKITGGRWPTTSAAGSPCSSEGAFCDTEKIGCIIYSFMGGVGC